MDVDAIVREGFEAARRGAPPGRCPFYYPEGSVGENAWWLGYSLGELTRPLRVSYRTLALAGRCYARASDLVADARAVGGLALDLLRGPR